MNKHTKSISFAALFAALILVATAFIKIPIGLGYVHIGDVFIMIAAYFLPPVYAVIAAALGSMLADLVAGYVVYMPVTFVIKGLMAFIMSLFYYRKFKFVKVIIGTMAASVFMLSGYFIFEGVYYGFAGAVANIPMSLVQPAVSIPIAVALIVALTKIPYVAALKEEIAFTCGNRKETVTVKAPDRDDSDDKKGVDKNR